MKTSLLPLLLTAVLASVLALLCGGLVFQFWRSYGTSIALAPQVAALGLLCLLVIGAWLGYFLERWKQVDSTDHAPIQP